MNRHDDDHGRCVAKFTMRAAVDYDDFAVARVPGGFVSREMAAKCFYRRRAWLTFLDWLESKRPR